LRGAGRQVSERIGLDRRHRRIDVAGVGVIRAAAAER
jgi:hypothetical protein